MGLISSPNLRGIMAQSMVQYFSFTGDKVLVCFRLFQDKTLFSTGNTERGWNDPPVFDYQSSSVLQSVHKRTNLNKRVAYPLSHDKEHGNCETTGKCLWQVKSIY